VGLFPPRSFFLIVFSPEASSPMCLCSINGDNSLLPVGYVNLDSICFSNILPARVLLPVFCECDLFLFLFLEPPCHPGCQASAPRNILAGEKGQFSPSRVFGSCGRLQAFLLTYGPPPPCCTIRCLNQLFLYLFFSGVGNISPIPKYFSRVVAGVLLFSFESFLPPGLSGLDFLPVFWKRASSFSE